MVNVYILFRTIDVIKFRYVISLITVVTSCSSTLKN